MIAFWVVLFANVQAGIAAGVGYSVLCLLLRLEFARVSLESGDGTQYTSIQSPTALLSSPDETILFQLQDSLLSPTPHEQSAKSPSSSTHTAHPSPEALTKTAQKAKTGCGTTAEDSSSLVYAGKQASQSMPACLTSVYLFWT
jgi:hypothetical protein